MSPAYERAAGEGGTGMFVRMKDYITNHTAARKKAMFHSASQTLKKELMKLQVFHCIFVDRWIGIPIYYPMHLLSKAFRVQQTKRRTTYSLDKNMKVIHVCYRMNLVWSCRRLLLPLWKMLLRYMNLSGKLQHSWSWCKRHINPVSYLQFWERLNWTRVVNTTVNCAYFVPITIQTKLPE